MPIYLSIYIFHIDISKQKKDKNLPRAIYSLCDPKQKKCTKIKISNGIQYKPQKGTFLTANKFF